MVLTSAYRYSSSIGATFARIDIGSSVKWQARVGKRLRRCAQLQRPPSRLVAASHYPI